MLLANVNPIRDTLPKRQVPLRYYVGIANECNLRGHRSCVKADSILLGATLHQFLVGFFNLPCLPLCNCLQLR
jgi:hypothetical protein